MSRFDDELTKTADNAYQMYKLPEPTQQGGYVTNQFQDPFAESFPTLTPPADDVANWTSNQPARRMLQVTDLNAAATDVMGGPGNSGVYASKDQLEESLYQVYKASRQIRDAIEAGTDFDFRQLYKAAEQSNKTARTASNDRWLTQTIGTIANLVDDIETNLLDTSDYRSAAANLREFESYLEEIHKYASDDDADDDPFAGIEANPTHCIGCGRPFVGGSADDGSDNATERHVGDIGECCKHLTDRQIIELRRQKPKGTTGRKVVADDNNGRHETLQHDDVRALDNVAPYMDNVGPNQTVDVTAPQPVNGQDAGYVPFYNDGAETGIQPGQGPHAQEVFPMDQTNPAFVPYEGLVASREKIFEALQVVERLEKLGMVQDSDRAKHIAKFEQMSDAKLAGFKASLDMLEESGARQPRSQKVASSSSNRMPEMGRLTTASTTTRGSIQADDWLMTL